MSGRRWLAFAVLAVFVAIVMVLIEVVESDDPSIIKLAVICGAGAVLLCTIAPDLWRNRRRLRGYLRGEP